MRPVNFRLVLGWLHSVAKRFYFFFEILRFLVDFGRFWEPKMEAGIDFGNVVCDVFFQRDFGINS